MVVRLDLRGGLRKASRVAPQVREDFDADRAGSRQDVTPQTSIRHATPQPIPLCKSLTLHNVPAAAAALPRNLRAPLVRFSPKRFRHARNTPSTNARLPRTAPSVKYLMPGGVPPPANALGACATKQNSLRRRRLHSSKHGLNGVKSNAVVNHRAFSRILPRGQPARASHDGIGLGVDSSRGTKR
jgi:hypothetical protein